MPKNHTNVKRNGDGVGNIVRPRDFQLSYALDLLRGMALIQRRNGD
jgi:hypothetical protein